MSEDVSNLEKRLQDLRSRRRLMTKALIDLDTEIIGLQLNLEKEKKEARYQRDQQREKER